MWIFTVGHRHFHTTDGPLIKCKVNQDPNHQQQKYYTYHKMYLKELV